MGEEEELAKWDKVGLELVGRGVKSCLTNSLPQKEGKKMYPAVDRSGGLFVIGIFAGKEPAWEACKKYRDQLEEKEQWLMRGLVHSRGKIGDKGHHWFAAEYPLDWKVE